MCQLSSFHSDKRQPRLLTSLVTAIKTEQNNKCVSAGRQSMARWERGDPASSPRRKMKPMAAILPTNTCVTPTPQAARLLAACVCSRGGGGGGMVLPCGDDYRSGRIWNQENRIKTESVNLERRLQLILVKNNWSLLVSTEKITSRHGAASGNSLLFSLGKSVLKWKGHFLVNQETSEHFRDELIPGLSYIRGGEIKGITTTGTWFWSANVKEPFWCLKGNWNGGNITHCDDSEAEGVICFMSFRNITDVRSPVWKYFGAGNKITGVVIVLIWVTE